MAKLHLDFETRSACELKLAGAYRYSIDSTTEVTHVGYRFDHRKPRQWLPGMPFPAEVADHVERGGVVVCHNAGFERRIWNNTLRRQVAGLAEMTIRQQSCTMARALIRGYPDDLDQLAQALRSSVKKDKAGGKLMLKYAKAIGLREDGAAIFAIPSPEDAEKVNAYNIDDVLAETEIDDLIPDFQNERERAIWELDQLINDRGLPIDVHEVRCAQELYEATKRRVNAEVNRLTGGMVQKVTEAGQIKQWLLGRGYQLDSVAEEALAQLDFTDDPQAAQVAELRSKGAKSSLAKFGKMLACVSDGRCRDQYAYAKANTGRWAGRLVQFHNLKKLNLKKDGKDIEAIFAAFEVFGMDGAETYIYVDLLTSAPVMSTLAKSMRQFVKAPPGRVLYGGDFSNVEGRFNAWVAGEDWKVAAFKRYDEGTGFDLYRLAYALAFGKRVEDVTDEERQIGKVMELSLGFQGGIGALLKAKGFKVGEALPVVRAAADPEVWNQFVEAYPSARDKHGLPVELWVALKIIVRGFRLQNAKIARSWFNLQEAAVEAVDNQGKLVKVPDYRGVSYKVSGGLLWCKLPSGRLLSYVAPFIEIENHDSLVWADGLIEDASEYTKEDIEHFVASGDAELVKRKPRRAVRFWGKEQGRWRVKKLYGGLQCENIVQATCRDFQADAMIRLESAGYSVVGHTHDDIITERNEGHGDVQEFQRIMACSSPWAPGMPLAVEAWYGNRYGK